MSAVATGQTLLLSGKEPIPPRISDTPPSSSTFPCISAMLNAACDKEGGVVMERERREIGREGGGMRGQRESEM